MNNDSRPIAELYLAWKTGLSHAKSVVRGIGVFAEQQVQNFFVVNNGLLCSLLFAVQ